MTRRPLRALLLAPVAACMALTLVWSAPAGADQSRAAFADTLDEILTDPRLDGAQASVVVADAESGDVLYEHNGDDRLMPASNSKLLSSAAAMDVLGPDYTFATEVRTPGRVVGGVLVGDLYLRGTGDPTLLYEDYQSLAAQLKKAGVRQVVGNLVADDTRFDDERYHWGWNVDDEQYYYGAPISALTVAPDTDYDAGTVKVTVEPGAAVGDRPKVSVYPDTGFVTVENTATTGEAGSSLSLPLNRKHGEDVITVSGSIAVDANPTSVWRAVWDPTGHATAVFKTALAEEGIRVVGKTRLGRATPDNTRLLASHESMTVAELMNPFMKLSNNGHAEVLVKAMGYESAGDGGWSAGTAAARDSLAGFGMDDSVYVLADGSGLTRRNWVPASEFATMLVNVRDEAWFDTWYEELPIACAGERFAGGTLNSRMCGTPAEKNAHAKTGSLTGATGLSGYVTDADGRELVFSIVLNYYMGSHPKDIEDRIVIALASHSADATAEELPAPRNTVPGDPEHSLDAEHDSAVVKPEDLTTTGHR
ncbi:MULTISPECIES: D-alanyl-D-alanine carboxypeptidase/D-alanyl-D-alanine-endopeptidase [unclassified Streptomyces]|uniref:D-alanyl-D-alanine carboxypeptidase/D-alanyl-D-alanine endopeptidase n=1 Tax=unclassified Streptomyces TaxID=2593676 RepID=UPI00215610B3|nr:MULTISPECIES: D-alanyl-D-alanine carboxypeptidase/D-alanyl-D-alanine-endopeptidase [unclassified Streptomyces]